MKKFVKIGAVTVVLTIIFAVILLGGCAPKVNDADANLDFDNMGSKPNAQAIAAATAVDKNKITLSETETTDAKVLESIKYIFLLANENAIAAPFFAAGAYGTGEAKINWGKGGKIVGKMDTREMRIFDNGEYFFDSFGLVVGGEEIKADGSKGSVPDFLVQALSSVLNFTERVYSPDNKNFYLSTNGKENENSLKNFPSYNAIEYSKPKATKYTLAEYEKTKFYRESYKGITTDNLDIENSITKGSITYDASTGIYRVDCYINCEDERVLEMSIKSMKKSSGTDTFKYASKHLTMEIWDCGLIKNYINSNVWEATLLPTSFKLKGSSDNYYEQRFTYNKSDLKIMAIPQHLAKALMH